MQNNKQKDKYNIKEISIIFNKNTHNKRHSTVKQICNNPEEEKGLRKINKELKNNITLANNRTIMSNIN